MQTHDLRTFSAHQYVRALGCLLLGALCAFQVSAQSVPATATGTVPVNFSAWGNTSTANSMAVDVMNRARYGMAPVSDGVGTSASSAFTNTAGTKIPVGVGGKIPSAAAAAAIGRFLGKIAGPLTVGIAAYDLAVELGFFLDNSTGAVVVKKPDPSVCTVGPCYQFGVPYPVQPPVSWSADKSSVCQAAITYLQGHQGGGTDVFTMSGYSPDCTYTRMKAGGIPGTGGGWTYVARTVETSPVTYLPSSQQEFIDAVAAKSGWPSSSAVARATNDAVKSGESVAVTPTSVTGPATSPGAEAVKVDPATGKTTTSTTTNNYNYAGPVITQTTTNVTSVSNTSTGAVETTTTTTEKPEVKPEPPADPCIDHPDRNGCRSDEFDTPTGEVPKTSKTITYQAENLGFGGGSCPANKTMTIAGGRQITLVDWVDNCSKITTYAKPMILAMAMFTAMMIIFAGGRPE